MSEFLIQNSYRWGKVITPKEDGAEPFVKDLYLGLENENAPLSMYIRDMKNMESAFSSTNKVMKAIKEGKLDGEAIDAYCELFGDEGFAEAYGLEGNLYLPGSKFNNLHEILNCLSFAGYDVRSSWRAYRDTSQKIWVNLPNFYANLEGTSQFKKTPDDYNLEKPYPTLLIPNDIEPSQDSLPSSSSNPEN